MTWAAGAVLTAAQLNANAPQEWSAYTPTLTNFTASSVSGRYVAHGKTVHVAVRIVLNAAPTGAMSVSLPVTAASTTNGHTGIAQGGDTGTANHMAFVALASTTTVLFVPAPSSAGQYNATTPFTWVSGDTLAFSLTYEAA